LSGPRVAAARAEWKAAHGDSQERKERFARDVVPLLANPPIAMIIKATGFSPRYASLVRKGEYMPHPVHYSTLARLARIREEEGAPIP
jgi:hypothetical protein